MAKSLFGRSAVVTGALLLSSLLFHANTSVAEHLVESNQAQQARTNDNSVASSEPAGQVLVDTSNVPAAPPVVVVETDPGPTPPRKTGELDITNGSAQTFTATAYALRGRTASGRTVARGLIAADRRVLPLGTRVRLDAGAYSGEYLVADRGSAVRGRKIDIWVPNNHEAMRFGRRPVRLTVLNYGGQRRSQSTTPARARTAAGPHR